MTPSLKPVEPELKVVDTPARIESLANVIDQLETERAGNDPRQPRSDEDEQPNSVIHAPQGFESFVILPSFPPSKALLNDHSRHDNHRLQYAALLQRLLKYQILPSFRPDYLKNTRQKKGRIYQVLALLEALSRPHPSLPPYRQ